MAAIYDISTKEFKWGKTEVRVDANLNDEKLKRGDLSFQLAVWMHDSNQECNIEVLNYEVKFETGDILKGNTSIPDLKIKENEYFSEINLDPDLIFIWVAREEVSLTNLNVSMTIVGGDNCNLTSSILQIEHKVDVNIQHVSFWQFIRDLIVFAT